MVGDAVEVQRMRLAVGEGVEMAATSYLPAGDLVGLVWCVPGGGVDRRYWDVPVDGARREEYSFPHRAAAAGPFAPTRLRWRSGGSSNRASSSAPPAGPTCRSSSASATRT